MAFRSSFLIAVKQLNYLTKIEQNESGDCNICICTQDAENCADESPCQALDQMLPFNHTMRAESGNWTLIFAYPAII